MQAINFEEALEQILAADRRFHRQAYFFLREALDHTQKTIGKPDPDVVHHVTGQELLEGIRQHALKEFGPMAMTVFCEWGVHRCEDWGEIVFNMIAHNLLAKTKQDSRDDFRGGYDFYTAFRGPFLPARKTLELLPEPKPQP
ncbi:MAG: hypothetical protein L0Y58_10765 [Verrucomicrobia subdivision 3 bacterium]|nr:hypothetical protein [Limisphaerales bacterium]